MLFCFPIKTSGPTPPQRETPVELTTLVRVWSFKGNNSSVKNLLLTVNIDSESRTSMAFCCCNVLCITWPLANRPILSSLTCAVIAMILIHASRWPCQAFSNKINTTKTHHRMTWTKSKTSQVLFRQLWVCTFGVASVFDRFQCNGFVWE